MVNGACTVNTYSHLLGFNIHYTFIIFSHIDNVDVIFLYTLVKKDVVLKLNLFNRRPKVLALKKKEKIMCFLHVMCDFPRAVIWRAKRKIVP